jgi:hypothetical protein
MTSEALTEKAGLSTAKLNVVDEEKTFLKGTEAGAPVRILMGPWGRGAMQWPNNGQIYSPPNEELTLSWVRASPRWDGSYVTSTVTSVPPGPAVIFVNKKILILIQNKTHTSRNRHGLFNGKIRILNLASILSLAFTMA